MTQPNPTALAVGRTSPPDARADAYATTHQVGDLIAEARQSLAEVLPAAAREAPTTIAVLVQRQTDAAEVRRALQLHAGHATGSRFRSADDPSPEVDVHVHDDFLSVAGVSTLLLEGVERLPAQALHTGRYVRVTLSEAARALATFWFPCAVPSTPPGVPRTA